MNYEETVNFIKLFLLLMNGGTFLLRTLIYKLTSESGKSLDDLLLQNRDSLDDKLKKNRKQFDLLFPGSSQNADIEQWDISLLTFVLLNVFKGLFDSQEIAAIKVIRDHRNKILAHNAKSEITLKDFMSAWIQVSSALTNLSTTVTPEDQKELKQIESTIFKDPFQKELVGQLNEIGKTDILLKAVIENVMPLIKDRISESEKKTQEEINKCIEQLTEIKKEQKKQGNQIALLVRMDFSTNSTRSRRQVQEHIKEASDNIIKGGFDFDSSNDEVSSAVGILFKGMEKQGIKVVKAEKGSILFTLLCPTVKSLRDVTLYLESPQIQPRLSYIEKAVEICHSCVAKITINVDLKSLQCATKKAGKGSVYLTLECNDEAGVRSAFKLFENGDSPNTLNKLSEALSREVGTKVELQTGIDIEKMKDTMEKLKDTNLFETEETTEYKDLVSKVLRIKQQALKLDISVNQNLTEESKTQSEDLVRMLNETTAETAVLDYEKTLDTRSKQTEEIQKQIQETKQQHEKMKEEEEQKQIQLKKLKATVAKEQEIIDDMDRRIHQTEKPHEKMRKEEERQQIQLKELEATIAKKQEIIDDLNRRIHQVCIAEIKLCFELVL
ncbi:uncharacterized protein LOC128553042 isoform X2 [Mercenaria mercenaria]|uniref:uncharacterized protein LOC128553042 isoform X2 n=1 Tax=Mercenaria mercenaria TaxID=6596 RepID=UPI00234F6F45|nr:uncharacterized protein LOC128553042 isoform X2 [Mercenaria mercenaria]